MRTETHQIPERCPMCGAPYEVSVRHLPTFGPDIQQYSVECTGDETHEPTPELRAKVQRLNAQVDERYNQG